MGAGASLTHVARVFVRPRDLGVERRGVRRGIGRGGVGEGSVGAVFAILLRPAGGGRGGRRGGRGRGGKREGKAEGGSGGGAVRPPRARGGCRREHEGVRQRRWGRDHRCVGGGGTNRSCGGQRGQGFGPGEALRCRGGWMLPRRSGEDWHYAIRRYHDHGRGGVPRQPRKGLCEKGVGVGGPGVLRARCRAGILGLSAFRALAFCGQEWWWPRGLRCLLLSLSAFGGRAGALGPRAPWGGWWRRRGGAWGGLARGRLHHWGRLGGGGLRASVCSARRLRVGGRGQASIRIQSWRVGRFHGWRRQGGSGGEGAVLRLQRGRAIGRGGRGARSRRVCPLG